MDKFPIILTVYNRPLHLKYSLNSLLKCEDLEKFKLYVFSDGPKDKDQLKNVQEVRKILNNYKNKINIEIINRKKNFGLLRNISQSLNFIFSKFDKAIIIEDDLIFHSKFLIFMKKSILKYQNNNKILQISGYSYPLKNLKNPYFAKLSSCWGWAISSKKWKEFSKFLNNKSDQITELEKIKKSKKLIYLFNYGGSFDYLSMLKKHLNKKINSWGIIFYLYMFKSNTCCFFPPRSFINNIGFDGSGNHNSRSNLFNTNQKPFIEFKLPKKIFLSNKAEKEIKEFFKRDLSLLSKIKRRINEKFI